MDMIARRLTGALVLAASLVRAAAAQSCDDDTIQSVSDDGAVIVMMSGSIFRVASADRLDTALWSTADDVLICGDGAEIVNKDENGERARVRRLR